MILSNNKKKHIGSLVVVVAVHCRTWLASMRLQFGGAFVRLIHVHSFVANNPVDNPRQQLQRRKCFDAHVYVVVRSNFGVAYVFVVK